MWLVAHLAMKYLISLPDLDQYMDGYIAIIIFIASIFYLFNTLLIILFLKPLATKAIKLLNSFLNDLDEIVYLVKEVKELYESVTPRNDK